MLGIAEMFSELDGYERYEDDLFSWAAHRLRAEQEARLSPIVSARKQRDYKKRYATSEEFRAQRREYWRTYHKKRYANDAAYRERHLKSAHASVAKRKAAQQRQAA